MASGATVQMKQAYPYEPQGKSFVIQTLCRAVIHAQSWDAVTSGCEALVNALRIAKDMEDEAFRHDFSAAAAEQKKQSDYAE